MQNEHRSRNPAGLETDKPIALRLMPDERADAISMAEKQGLSLSAYARKCYLSGKKALFPDSPAVLPRRRLKRGGGGQPAPARSTSSERPA